MRIVIGLVTGLMSLVAAQAVEPWPLGGGRLGEALGQMHVDRDLEYARPAGKSLHLDLYRPQNAAGPLPVIVWIHGGGWQSGSKQQCLPAMPYVSRGYAVASLDYRLSDEATFPAQIQDCKAAVRWLRAHAQEYGLDANRFAAWGSSAGGHLAAMLGTAGDVKAFDVGEHLSFSSRVQAVCDYYGPTDLEKMVSTYVHHASANSPESKLLGGPVLGNREAAAKASPVSYVSKDDPPFLIVHGESDPVVPVGQSRLLSEALQKAGVPSSLTVIPGAKHGGPDFMGPAVAAEVAAFLGRHLKGEAEASAKRPTPATRPVAGQVASTRPVAAATAFALNGERWTYWDGTLSMGGILVKPAGTGPFPAILVSHGMGGSAESFTMHKARLLAQKGFVCIGPNYTHSLEAMRGDGPGFRPRPGDEKGPGASSENLRRAEKCLEILAGLPYVDQKRIYAYGHSMGGFVTIGLAARLPGRLAAAAVTGSGVASRAGFPAPSADDAGRIRTPFYLIHGERDRTVPPERSAMLKEILDRNGIACERKLFLGVDHAVDREKSAEMIELLSTWFGRYPAER